MYHVTLYFVGGGHITCRNTELICCKTPADLVSIHPGNHQIVVNTANVSYMRLASEQEIASVECGRRDRV